MCARGICHVKSHDLENQKLFCMCSTSVYSTKFLFLGWTTQHRSPCKIHRSILESFTHGWPNIRTGNVWIVIFCICYVRRGHCITNIACSTPHARFVGMEDELMFIEWWEQKYHLFPTKYIKDKLAMNQTCLQMLCDCIFDGSSYYNIFPKPLKIMFTRPPHFPFALKFPSASLPRPMALVSPLVQCLFTKRFYKFVSMATF
jgi:hypothetical protein